MRCIVRNAPDSSARKSCSTPASDSARTINRISRSSRACRNCRSSAAPSSSAHRANASLEPRWATCRPKNAAGERRQPSQQAFLAARTSFAFTTSKKWRKSRNSLIACSPLENNRNPCMIVIIRATSTSVERLRPMISHKLKFTAVAAVFVFALALRANAQGLPPVKKAFQPKVPQGAYGCSIHASCADAAPIIIKSIQGPSPLEKNLRELTDTIGGRVTGTPAAEKAVDWAVNAFRQAGVDEVLTENFTLPNGWAEGRTRLLVQSPRSEERRVGKEGRSWGSRD